MGCSRWWASLTSSTSPSRSVRQPAPTALLPPCEHRAPPPPTGAGLDSLVSLGPLWPLPFGPSPHPGGLSNGVRLCQGKTLRLYAPSKGVPLQARPRPRPRRAAPRRATPRRAARSLIDPALDLALDLARSPAAQVDGEPFNQPSDKPFTGLDCEPFDFSLERSDSALMLAAPLGAGGAEGAAEVAIERGVATGAVSVEQRESLLREIAT